MNRSSWASGSSNVPACSTGFWVAITRNGDGSRNASLPMVAFRSCMASNRADCTLGAAPVDLVGQQQVREDRPLVHPEVVGAGVEDFRPEDIRRQQVDGELDAGELQVDGLRQARHQQRFGQPGDAFEQQVTAGEQGDQDALDDHVLADDHGADAGADAVQEADDGIRGGDPVR